MSYKPGDAYYGEFVTSSTAGAAVNADSLPSATPNKNGTDDGATFTLTVVNLDTGRYKITGTIPVGYVKGDVVNVHVSATIGGVAAKCVVDGFIIDSKRVGDLNDAAALTDYQQRGVAVTLPSIPANWITAAGIAASALNGKGDWLVSSSYPSHFSLLAIDLAGAVTVGTNSDKTGYSLTVTPPTAAQIATTIFTDLFSGSDFSTVGSFGAWAKANIAQTGDSFAIVNNGTYGNSAIHNQIGTPQQTGVAVTLPANPPAGFIIAASIGTAALNGKGDWNTVAPDNASITAIKAVTDKIGFTGSGPWTVNANATISGNVTVGGYAAGQDPATLVWSATASSFNVGGTMGSKLNAAGSSADPLSNAVPGTYTIGSGGYALGKLLTGNVTVTTPVSVGGDTTIIRGDDYTGTRAIAYRDNAGLWPDNPTTVDWYITRPDAPNTVVLHKTVTVSPTSGNPKTGTVALSNADTAGLYDSTYHLYMVWTAGGVTYTLIQGTLTVNTR